MVEPKELTTEEQTANFERVLEEVVSSDSGVTLRVYQTWRDAPVTLSLKRGAGKPQTAEIEARLLFSRSLETVMRDRLGELYERIKTEERGG